MAAPGNVGAGAPSNTTNGELFFSARREQIQYTINSLSHSSPFSLKDRCQILYDFTEREIDSLPSSLSPEENAAYLNMISTVKKMASKEIQPKVSEIPEKQLNAFNKADKTLEALCEFLYSIKYCFILDSVTMPKRALLPPYLTTVLKTFLAGHRSSFYGF